MHRVLKQRNVVWDLPLWRGQNFRFKYPRVIAVAKDNHKTTHQQYVYKYSLCLCHHLVCPQPAVATSPIHNHYIYTYVTILGGLCKLVQVYTYKKLLLICTLSSMLWVYLENVVWYVSYIFTYVVCYPLPYFHNGFCSTWSQVTMTW